MIKKIKDILFNDIGLKVLSLALAFISWFYITGELNRLALEGEMGIQGGAPYKISARALPVLLNIRGKVAEGYRIDESKVIIMPQACNVIGLKRLLDKIEFIKTAPIDVDEYKETVTIRVSLESPSRAIKIVDRFVTIVIPIEKDTNDHE